MKYKIFYGFLSIVAFLFPLGDTSAADYKGEKKVATQKSQQSASNWSTYMQKQLKILDEEKKTVKETYVSQKYRDALWYASSATIFGKAYNMHEEEKGENAFHAGFKDSITQEESQLAIRLLQHLAEVAIYQCILITGLGEAGLKEQEKGVLASNGAKVGLQSFLSDFKFDRVDESQRQKAINQFILIAQIVGEKLNDYFSANLHDWNPDYFPVQVNDFFLPTMLIHYNKMPKEEVDALIAENKEKAKEIAKLIPLNVPKLPDQDVKPLILTQEKLNNLLDRVAEIPEFNRYTTDINRAAWIGTISKPILKLVSKIIPKPVEGEKISLDKYAKITNTIIQQYNNTDLRGTIALMLGVPEVSNWREADAIRYDIRRAIKTIKGYIEEDRKAILGADAPSFEELDFEENFLNPAILGVVIMLHYKKIPSLTNIILPLLREIKKRKTTKTMPKVLKELEAFYESNQDLQDITRIIMQHFYALGVEDILTEQKKWEDDESSDDSDIFDSDDESYNPIELY